MDTNDSTSSMSDMLTFVGRFADELAEAEPDPIKRADWMVYVLKALAEKSNQVTYEEMLKRVADSVSARLSSGAW